MGSPHDMAIGRFKAESANKTKRSERLLSEHEKPEWTSKQAEEYGKEGHHHEVGFKHGKAGQSASLPKQKKYHDAYLSGYEYGAGERE